MALQATQDPNMKPGWLLKLGMSHGTYNGAPNYSTHFGYLHDEAVDHDDHEAIIQYAGQKLASVLGEHITVDSFYLRQHAHTPGEGGINRREFRGGKLNIRGKRTLPANAVWLPANVTMRWPKIAKTGKAGRLELRGCLNSADVTHDAVGSMVLKPNFTLAVPPADRNPIFSLFGGLLVAEWPHGELTMLDSPLYITDYSRGLRTIGQPEIGEKQIRNKHTTVSEADIDAKIRHAREIKREVIFGLRNAGEILKGPAWAARMSQLAIDFTQALLGLPLDKAARLALEEGSKEVLAFNEATDLPAILGG
jgi:hypothetical protein